MDQNALAQLQSRTVKILATGQVLGGFGLGSVLSIGALLAEKLSGSAAWSGSAATFSTLGAATLAIPLARLANARGRRVALATGASIAISGAILIIAAAYLEIFPLLLLSLLMLGAGSATSLQARFAATDLPAAKSTGRDLSLVVWATTAGAVIGPNLFGPGEIIGHALNMPLYTGPFLFTITAQILSSTVFWFGLRPDPLLTAKQAKQAKASDGSATEDPGNLVKKSSLSGALAVLKTNPTAAYALTVIALSHMVMVSVMSMTPIHMKSHGATLVLVGFTISMHVAGMYAFSPIFGWLADKIGQLRTVVLGQLIYVAALTTAGFGSENHDLVVVGLFLLGLGWSASTVSGSALLSSSLSIEEKATVQGVSDSLMSLAGALGGAVAGTILAAFAFVGLNLAALIPASLILIATLIQRRRNFVA
jgi:MFS family permease